MTAKFSPEIENEIEKSAAASRAAVASVKEMTAAARAAIVADTAAKMADWTTRYNAAETDAEKVAIVTELGGDLLTASVNSQAVEFYNWANASETERPGLGEMIIADFLSSTGTAIETYKRSFRPSGIVSRYDRLKNETARRAASEKRIAAIRARGFDPCDRCGGAGGWKGWPGYTCYKCGGRGYVTPNQAALNKERH